MQFIESILESNYSKLFFYIKCMVLALIAVVFTVSILHPDNVPTNITLLSFVLLTITTVYWSIFNLFSDFREITARNIFFIDSIAVFLFLYPAFYQNMFFFTIPVLYVSFAPVFFSKRTFPVVAGFIFNLFILANIVFGIQNFIENPIQTFISYSIIFSLFMILSKATTYAFRELDKKRETFEKERSHMLSRQEKLSRDLSLSKQNSQILNRDIRKRDIEIKNLMVLSGQLNVREDSKVILNSFLLTLVGQIGASYAAILTRQKKHHNYISIVAEKGLRDLEYQNMRLYTDSNLIQILDTVREPVLVSELPIENLYDDEIKLIKYFKNDLICPVRIRNMFIGAVLIGHKISHAQFNKEDLDLTSIIANQTAFVLEQSKLTQNYKEFYAKTIRAMLESLETKYIYARGHNVRTANYAAMIGRRLKLPPNQIKNLTYGSLLHDIGKIAIKDEYLLNTAKFANEDTEIKNKILEHTLEGSKILKSAGFNAEIIDLALHHHEFYNGRGYPHKIGESDLSLNSRILAVCNAYDAMTSDRPHRKALPAQTAQEFLFHSQNSQFDPEIVKIFLEEIGRQATN